MPCRTARHGTYWIPYLRLSIDLLTDDGLKLCCVWSINVWATRSRRGLNEACRHITSMPFLYKNLASTIHHQNPTLSWRHHHALPSLWFDLIPKYVVIIVYWF